MKENLNIYFSVEHFELLRNKMQLVELCFDKVTYTMSYFSLVIYQIGILNITHDELIYNNFRIYSVHISLHRYFH